MLTKLFSKRLFDLESNADAFDIMLNKLVPKFSKFKSKLPIDFDIMSNKFVQNLDST